MINITVKGIVANTDDLPIEADIRVFNNENRRGFLRILRVVL